MTEGERLIARFTEAHEEFSESIFRYFAYRLNDRERAKELTQETFARAWTYASGGGTVRAMKAFLFTTAGNLYKNELRGRKPVTSLDALLEGGREFVSEEATIEEKAEAKLLLGKLGELSEQDREVLTLRYVDQLSAKEIAPMLGLTPIAVSVRVHRALKRLRSLHQP